MIGGRDFTGRAFLNAKLDGVHRKHGITRLIQRGRDGAEALAVDWARRNEVPMSTYPSWREHFEPPDDQKREAHMKLDTLMLKESQPDVLIGFKGDDETRDCIDQARAMGIRVWETWL